MILDQKSRKECSTLNLAQKSEQNILYPDVHYDCHVPIVSIMFVTSLSYMVFSSLLPKKWVQDPLILSGTFYQRAMEKFIIFLSPKTYHRKMVGRDQLLFLLHKTNKMARWELTRVEEESTEISNREKANVQMGSMAGWGSYISLLVIWDKCIVQSLTYTHTSFFPWWNERDWTYPKNDWEGMKRRHHSLFSIPVSDHVRVSFWYKNGIQRGMEKGNWIKDWKSIALLFTVRNVPV